MICIGQNHCCFEFWRSWQHAYLECMCFSSFACWPFRLVNNDSWYLAPWRVTFYAEQFFVFFLFFLLNCFSIMATDWAKFGWIQSFIKFQKIYILQCNKLEFPCCLPSLSRLFWLLHCLLHAAAKVQVKPGLHICYPDRSVDIPLQEVLQKDL